MIVLLYVICPFILGFFLKIFHISLQQFDCDESLHDSSYIYLDCGATSFLDFVILDLTLTFVNTFRIFRPFFFFSHFSLPSHLVL